MPRRFAARPGLWENLAIMTIPTPLPAAVLFDFDGTLVETEPHWIAAESALADRLGGRWTHDDGLRMVGRNTRDMAVELIATITATAGSCPVDAEQILGLIFDEVARRCAATDDLFTPGALELLAELSGLGVPLALVTSSPRQVLDPVLGRLPAGTFAVTVAGDEVEAPKPDPEPYLTAARELGVDPADCLVVEDSPSGAASGNAAGSVVVAVHSMVPVPDAPRRLRLRSLEGVRAHDLAELHQAGLRGRADAGLSGVRTGLLQPGERVTLTDPKGRRHSVLLQPGRIFHTTKGGVAHEDILGGPEGVVVTSAGGMEFLVMRPLMSEFTVTMPREAAVIYPKDAAQILMWTDIFPGARVLEAGVGSGALSIALLRAIGTDGRLHSYERREEFAEVARRNVEAFLGGGHPAWELTVGDLVASITDEPVDRAVLDMLAPWECVDAVGERLVPGGVLTCYVATTTQMGRVMDTLRAHGGFTEPHATETTVRDWHAEGLAIRPAHSTTGHTGFLVVSRKLAPGVRAPLRKRRPAPGAYGPDYTGPRPANIPVEFQNRPAE